MRADIAARWSWDEQLLGCVARLRGRVRTAIVWNAWPHARVRLAADGVAGLVDAVVLSCDADVAKPDRRIFELALGRLDAQPGQALFIDDTPGHVAAAEALGMAGSTPARRRPRLRSRPSSPPRELRAGSRYRPGRCHREESVTGSARRATLAT
ncbi:MAG TPA: HAD-IA family hydrolase [Streptosporangiaceae bacterium]